MAEFTLELDAKTLEHVRRIAQARNASVEHLIREVIDLLILAEKEGDPIVGMFAHEPELIDQVVASAMMARETDPLRL
jgi:hypothetical protein